MEVSIHSAAIRGFCLPLPCYHVAEDGESHRGAHREQSPHRVDDRLQLEFTVRELPGGMLLAESNLMRWK